MLSLKPQLAEPLADRLGGRRRPAATRTVRPVDQAERLEANTEPSGPPKITRVGTGTHELRALDLPVAQTRTAAFRQLVLQAPA
ncbi:hypothetical protein [Actinomadura terrae]|uniref:hypothetical protein n=1 Tax=Actinomadura terrae TaxID=604353 RepID=UPI001FA74CFE|nr:hypothetical protein [Actinomadura terrae]